MPKVKLHVKQASVKFTATDGNLAAPQFVAERFRGWAPSHQATVISGSSSLYFNPPELGDHAVCDAAALNAVDPHALLNNKPLQFSFAVADGLGYEVEDKNFNRSLGEVAGSASQYLVENSHYLASNPTEILKDTARYSKQFSLKKSKNESYDSECSLAAGHIHFDGQNWKGYFTNIGDGMIVVISGVTHQVKAIIPARTDRRLGGVYSPQSVQDSLTANVDLGLAQINLDEGDLIVAMTDGVYGNYELEVQAGEVAEGMKPDQPDYQKTKIKPASLESALAPLSPRNYPSVYEVAKTIVQHGMTKHQDEFKRASELYRAIQDFVKDKPSDTQTMALNDFLNSLQHISSPLYEKLRRYLLGSEGRDGVSFKLDKARICDLLDVLNTQEYGDCTTLTVMRVPFYTDELIRLLLEDPTHAKVIASEIRRHLTEAELPNVLARLGKETLSPGPVNHSGFKVGQEKLYYRYSAKELVRVEELVQKILKDQSLSSLLTSLKHLTLECAALLSSDEKVTAHGEKISPLILSEHVTPLENTLDIIQNEKQKAKIPRQ